MTEAVSPFRQTPVNRMIGVTEYAMTSLWSARPGILDPAASSHTSLLASELLLDVGPDMARWLAALDPNRADLFYLEALLDLTGGAPTRWSRSAHGATDTTVLFIAGNMVVDQAANEAAGYFTGRRHKS